MQWSLENLKDGRLWLRVGYATLVLVILTLCWHWIFYALLFLWLIQSFFWLFTGQISEQLAITTRFLVLTFYHYLEYLTYTTQQKPFPLDRLP